MSQHVNPILFNNYIYNTSKWFNKINNKFLLNEDLQIREIINILFKNNITAQFLFIDKIVIYKYSSKMKIYIYFFCNFNYLKKNIIINKNYENKQFLNIFYFYYKYLEILNIKKIEILKLLSFLKSKNNNILLYFKNINYNYNSVNLFINKIQNKSKKIKNLKSLQNINSMNYNLDLFNITLNNNIIISNKTNIKNTKIKKVISNKKKFKFYKKKYNNYRFTNLKYFKTICFILYILCYNNNFLNKLNASSLINIIYYEINSLNNRIKNYNFLFYNIFNLIRDKLSKYLKDDNCKIKGIRIQVKGRYFLTKRKRIFIFNLGNLNLNKINLKKDYYCLNLIKSTGSSSIKIWISYKN